MTHCPGATSAEMPVSVRAMAALCRSVGPGDAPSNRPSAIFLPFSFVTSVPGAAARASNRSAISLRAGWRRLRSRDQGEVWNARRGAAMAARASASPPSAHRPSTAPVAGLTDSETVPDPVHSPSIQCLAISLMCGLLQRYVSGSHLMVQVLPRYDLHRQAIQVMPQLLDSVLIRNNRALWTERTGPPGLDVSSHAGLDFT